MVAIDLSQFNHHSFVSSYLIAGDSPSLLDYWKYWMVKVSHQTIQELFEIISCPFKISQDFGFRQSTFVSVNG